jgi:hypothetical protein
MFARSMLFSRGLLSDSSENREGKRNLPGSSRDINSQHRATMKPALEPYRQGHGQTFEIRYRSYD